MRLLPTRATIFLATLSACRGPLDAPPPHPHPQAPVEALDPQVVAGIEEAARADLEASLASGAQIAIWLEGRIVYQGQLGSAHPDRQVPITPDTLFMVGSDTKKLTALALLKQVERGNLSLDDTVAEAIPGFALASTPGWAEQATLHHLLSNQAGLYDYTPWDADPDDAALQERTYGEFAENEWAHTTPGDTWNYSNPNFSLAGAATEVAAGEPYADILAEDLFGPLGMTRTFARHSEVLLESDVAASFGYQRSPFADPYDPLRGGELAWGTVEVADIVDNAWTRPAGLVWSTATDMARLSGWLIDGDEEVLEDDLRELVTTPHINLYPAYDGFTYGYGVLVGPGIDLGDGYRDMVVWNHGGNTLSYTSTTWMLPEQRLAVTIHSNGSIDDFTGTVMTIFQTVVELPAPTDPPPIAGETDHTALVGAYVDPYVGRMVVTDLDGALQISLPDLENASVEPTLYFTGIPDVYAFQMDGEVFDLTFVSDAEGRFRLARNRMFVGTRADPDPEPGACPLVDGFVFEQTADVAAGARLALLDVASLEEPLLMALSSADAGCPVITAPDAVTLVASGPCTSTDGVSWSGALSMSYVGDDAAGTGTMLVRYDDLSVAQTDGSYRFAGHGTWEQVSDTLGDHVVHTVAVDYTLAHAPASSVDGTFRREQEAHVDFADVRTEGYVHVRESPFGHAGDLCMEASFSRSDTCAEPDGAVTITGANLAHAILDGSNGCDGCVVAEIDGVDAGESCGF